jgi:FtsH-binding integral membrane protein
VVILKGADKIVIPEKFWFALFLLVVGTVILLATIFHHKAQKQLRHLTGIVSILEAMVMSVVGYLYLSDGKVYLPYVCFGAALMFLIAAVIYFTKHKNTSVRTH